MNFYIAFFLPCILGLSLYSYLTKEKNIVSIVINYFLITFLSNMMSMIILILRHTVREGVNIMAHMEYSFPFGVKYMLMTMVFSVGVALVIYVINKYFSFSIEVVNGRKKKEDI